MKELSIEEKAKAYDGAIKVARSKIKNDKNHVLYEEDIIDIFPVLKEERIRKKLIAFLKENLETGSADETWNVSDIERWIAWLEKQGEQKPYERKDFISIPFGAFDSELVNETITIQDGCVATIEGNKIHIKKK